MLDECDGVADDSSDLGSGSEARSPAPIPDPPAGVYLIDRRLPGTNAPNRPTVLSAALCVMRTDPSLYYYTLLDNRPFGS